MQFKSKIKKWASEKSDGLRAVGCVAGVGLLLWGPAIVDYGIHIREAGRASASVKTVMERKTDDREMMKVLSELCFGEKNAEDLLKKINAIATTGALRGDYNEKAPNGGLWWLVQSYWQGSKGRGALCFYSTISTLGHQPVPYSSNIKEIIDLYESGKLNGLIQEYEKRKKVEDTIIVGCPKCGHPIHLDKQKIQVPLHEGPNRTKNEK